MHLNQMFVDLDFLSVTYLFRTTGQVIGVSLSGAVLQAVLLNTLRSKITGPGAEEIIESVRCAS